MFKKKSDSKPNPALVNAVMSKAVLTWTTEDVSNWIRGIGYGDYCAKFLKHAIGGQELVTITASDLKAIGVTTLGHQKAILAKVSQIQADSEAAAAKASVAAPPNATSSSVKDSDLSSVDDDGGSESGSSSVTTAANRLELIVTYGEARRSVMAKKAYGLDRILSKLEDVYTFPVEIKYKGKLVEEQSQWAEMVGRHSATDPMELTVERENPNKIHKEERAMLHGLVDVCILIDKIGTILFCNLATEDILGYEQGELVGKNVRDLTPPEVRVKHDSYLRRYLETGNAKVIGSGRQVQVIHKKGHEISCWLSVTEQKKASGRHTFMGTLHEIKSRDVSVQTAKFAVLDGIGEAVLVINSQGAMQFMNSRLEKLLGYKKDILGRNINTIMPEPYASAHDSYLRNYLKSGTPKVIGRGGRVVVAKHANGSVIPIHLEVDECILEGQRYFVGCMMPKDATRKKKQTLIERTRTVVDQLAVASIVIDPKGTVQAFNAAAVALFGWDASEVISKNVMMLCNDVDARQHDGYLARHMQTGEEKVIGKFRLVQAKHKNGKLFDVNLSISKSIDPDDANNVLFTGTVVATKK